MCKTCKILRPPRSFHCSTCGTCIDVHDHHCPWVGNCVGKLNHIYFFKFIVWVTIITCYTVVIDLVVIINFYPAWRGDIGIKINIFAIFVLFYAGGFFVSVGPFSIYHLKIALQNRTSNEELRDKFKKVYNGSNPFTKGCKQNW